MGTREGATQGDREEVAGEAGGGNTRGRRSWGPQNMLHEESLVIHVICCSEVPSMKVESSGLVKLKAIGSRGKGEVCGMHVTKGLLEWAE